MTRTQHDDVLSTTSEISYDPYADVVDPSVANPPTVSMSQHIMHMPYACTFPAAPPMQPQQHYLTIVHHSGRVAWVPYQDGATLASLREEASRQMGLPPQQFQFARACPLMEEISVTQQCMPNDVIYILPNTTPKPVPVPEMQAPMHVYAKELPSQPVTPLLPSVPTTPLSTSGSFTSAMFPALQHASFSGATTPLSMPGTAPGWSVPLDEKLANAAANLSQIISQSRQCTELQQDLEVAVARGIDCSPVFQACERNLAELILHPSGNYLVSKCFDLCPGLIESAANIIASEVRMYALHKHGSYVVEAILTSSIAPKHIKGELISALISPTNRISVATHDSGNFVLQKAIENCPEEMLWQLQEAVQSVFHMSTHGPKMLKKLEARLSKSQPAAHAASKSGNTLPLPPSTVAYINQVSLQPCPTTVPPNQAVPQHVPVTHAPYARVGAKETWSLDTTTKDKPAAAQSAYRECIRGPYMGSWADAEDSPPRMFMEGGRVALP